MPDTIEPGPRFNVLSGDNGQGKTNLLEAIYAVCSLRSFRASRLRDLIALGKDEARVAARVERQGLERLYELKIGQRSRTVRLDGKTVRPIARYFGGFNVVLFAPEDMLVVRASPGDRRKFIDRAVFTLRPGHLLVAQDYDKTLKSRNATLKNEELSPAARDQLLDVYDLQAAKLGAELISARRSYLQGILPLYQAAFDAITQIGLPVSLHYECSTELPEQDSELEAALLDAITRSRRADLARGSSNVGPHRDLLRFSLAEQEAGSFASQGQMRAMVLAWKTAEMRLLDSRHDDPPLLLLDDVSSELDPQRNEYLFAFLREQKSQCFITSTHPSYVLLSEERRDFRVVAGSISNAD